MSNELSVAKILGKKAIYVSFFVVSTEKIDMGKMWFAPYQSMFGMSFRLYDDGSVAITLDADGVYEFDSKAKATKWLKRKLKPITDKTRVMIHIHKRFDRDLRDC